MNISGLCKRIKLGLLLTCQITMELGIRFVVQQYSELKIKINNNNKKKKKLIKPTIIK